MAVSEVLPARWALDALPVGSTTWTTSRVPTAPSALPGSGSVNGQTDSDHHAALSARLTTEHESIPGRLVDHVHRQSVSAGTAAGPAPP